MSWIGYLAEELDRRGETEADITGLAPGADALIAPFDRFGTPIRGFTVWTAKRVYFPTVYDSFPSVQSVAREPCTEITFQVNGGQDDEPPRTIQTEAQARQEMAKWRRQEASARRHEATRKKRAAEKLEAERAAWMKRAFDNLGI